MHVHCRMQAWKTSGDATPAVLRPNQISRHGTALTLEPPLTNTQLGDEGHVNRDVASAHGARAVVERRWLLRCQATSTVKIICSVLW